MLLWSNFISFEANQQNWRKSHTTTTAPVLFSQGKLFYAYFFGYFFQLKRQEAVFTSFPLQSIQSKWFHWVWQGTSNNKTTNKTGQWLRSIYILLFPSWWYLSWLGRVSIFRNRFFPHQRYLKFQPPRPPSSFCLLYNKDCPVKFPSIQPFLFCFLLFLKASEIPTPTSFRCDCHQFLFLGLKQTPCLDYFTLDAATSNYQLANVTSYIVFLHVLSPNAAQYFLYCHFLSHISFYCFHSVHAIHPQLPLLCTT